MNNGLPLPEHHHVDVGKLLGLFKDTTNSYKYLFFLALLELTADCPAASAPRFTTRQVLETALAIAWFPHSYFRLSFGTQDQVAAALDELAPHLPSLSGTLKPHDVQSLRTSIGRALTAERARPLLRYVPYRMLTPWFAESLRGMADYRKDAALARLSIEQFRSAAPLYRLEDGGEALQLHPDWWDYLLHNHSLVRDWARWNWLAYMQSRNPSTLNVAGKLLPPLDRAPLTEQRRFWTQHLKRCEIRCIYTGQPLDSVEALDHFLPWSFVLHDRWWNLVPVVAAANSAKRDHLPNLDRHLNQLVGVHAEALVASRQWLHERGWQAIAAHYVEDLRIPIARIAGDPSGVRDALHSGYRQVLPNLMALAELQGFHAGWQAAG